MRKKNPDMRGRDKAKRDKSCKQIEKQRQKEEKQRQKEEKRRQKEEKRRRKAEKRLENAQKRQEKKAARRERWKNSRFRAFWVRAWAWLRGIPWKKAVSWLTCIPWRRVGRVAWRYSKRHLVPVTAFLICMGLGVAAFALILSAAVCDKTSDRIKTADELLALGEQFDCILVLGCMAYSDGSLSARLSDRVETATQLYHKGVSGHILMSGDNQDVYYNEVDPMRAHAVGWGVPEEAIDVDRLGLSTYDSLARIAEEYKGRRVVIVTQRYHLYRALYIAEKLGLDAYGVSADKRIYSDRYKCEVREILARCKDVWYSEKRPAAAGMEK